jgi:hypothetical protein
MAGGTVSRPGEVADYSEAIRLTPKPCGAFQQPRSPKGAPARSADCDAALKLGPAMPTPKAPPSSTLLRFSWRSKNATPWLKAVVYRPAPLLNAAPKLKHGDRRAALQHC